jgi:hypothetical protein
VGYTIKKDVKFIPISALAGHNVKEEVPSEKCAWWREMYTSGGHNTFTPTLISTLDALAVEGRNPEGPLRVPCLDRYFERGTVVLGKVRRVCAWHVCILLLDVCSLCSLPAPPPSLLRWRAACCAWATR